jgi:hypothetical protein
VAAQIAVAPEATAIFGQPTMSHDLDVFVVFPRAVEELAPNTLLLGWGTVISYDSNILDSQPHTADVQYTFYPLIGLKLARPRWGAVLSFAPGLAYSTANLPQYQAVSLTSTVAFNYQASERLSFGLSNSFVSSSNPFNSLTTSSTTGQGTTNTASTAGNYLPRTNELAVVDASYNVSARTSLVGSTSYKYINYQHNSDIPDAVQLFQTSTSTKASIGLRYRLSPKCYESMRYVAQFLSAGPGMIKTLGQSIQYGFAYAPRAGLRVSSMIGPQFVENTYRVSAGGGNLANVVRGNTSGWTWTGNLAVSQTLGKNQISANASRQLTTGTQYQGNVLGTTFTADFSRPIARKTDFTVSASYNMSKPVFLVQLAPRLSNNYASTGVTLSRAIGEHWQANCTYWYLFQDSPQNGPQLYSGDHNRVAVSLTYSLTRALPQ